MSGSYEIHGGGPTIALDSPLLELNEWSQSHRADFFPPVMSYIDPDKWIGSGAGFLLHQPKIWNSWLQEAGRVALVGVSVRDQNAPDAHLWKPLRESKAQILYVSPNSAGAFEEWANGCGRQGIELFPKPGMALLMR